MISSVRSSPPHRPVIKKKKRNYENRVQIERVSDFVNIVNEERSSPLRGLNILIIIKEI